MEETEEAVRQQLGHSFRHSKYLGGLLAAFDLFMIVFTFIQLEGK